jgi:hypothetical protein
MRRDVDMAGRRLGTLVVLSREGREPTGEARWRWRCDCGREGVSRSTNLRRPKGRTQSCGCQNPATRPDDLSGLSFGRWLVLRRSGARRQHYLCRCGCGTEREVYGPSLTGGRSESCGKHCPAK